MTNDDYRRAAARTEPPWTVQKVAIGRPEEGKTRPFKVYAGGRTCPPTMDEINMQEYVDFLVDCRAAGDVQVSALEVELAEARAELEKRKKKT